MEIIIFICVQLVNVITSVVKSIATIKASTKVAAIINAVSYTVSAVTTYFIAKRGLIVVVPVTFICNYIGVYIGRWIVDKMSKDKLWIYHATFYKWQADKVLEVKELLKSNGVASYFVEVVPNEIYDFKAFAYSRADSEVLEDFFRGERIKFYRVESI